MTSILPKGPNLKKQVAAYVTDTRTVINGRIKLVESKEGFSQIYQTSLAASTVLGGLSGANLKPGLTSPKAIARRVPLLVVIGQASAASAELRRFAELIIWTIYFTDHPVEWEEFLRGSGGFTRDGSKPISYSAHRELSYYMGYVRELMSAEPSGLTLKAVQGLSQAQKDLNALIHAGHLARTAGRYAPYDSVEEKDLRKFLRLQTQVFSSCCLLLAAYQRDRFNHMSAISRAYFDYLIGSPLRKQLRSGPFGLR